MRRQFEIICVIGGRFAIKKKFGPFTAKDAKDAVTAAVKSFDVEEFAGYTVKAMPVGQARKREKEWRIRRHENAIRYHKRKLKEL